MLPEAYFSTVGEPNPPTTEPYPNQRLDPRPSTFAENDSYPASLPAQHWATHPYRYSPMSSGPYDILVSPMRPTAWVEVHDSIDYGFHMGNEVAMSSAPRMGYDSAPAQPTWPQTSWMSSSRKLPMLQSLLMITMSVLQLFSVSCGAAHLCQHLEYDQCCQHPHHLT